ncbi:MAG: T9SS type A sorting domain-containing protein [Chitinophagaceae bacterium]|nr:MAG: T9SS type A sorting domain-containing protein [Chitinophagaceae bacterium]
MRFLSGLFLAATAMAFSATSHAQVIITQYYEGGGTNKWIELTNLGTSAVNTASPQLRLGLWAVAGSAGTINITGAPSQQMDLNFIIPAKGSVLIGTPANGTEVPYLTSASAAQTSSAVMNFNGNDGVALMDGSNNIIDAFGTGINAVDRSYYRNLSVTGASAGFTISEWTMATLAVVQGAAMGNPARLNYHLDNTCVAPAAAPASAVYYSITANSIGGAFSSVTADEYLVLLSTSATLSALPQNGVVYNNGNVIGNATVINRSANNIFYASGLQPSTPYYFFIFALNSNCMAGPVYLTSQLLTTTNVTAATPQPGTALTYFGNLHSHSSYSDGNMDDPTKTPADDYAFAKESMCMDFLGISEHNHTGAGMSLSRWQPGLAQAAAASSASFLAMYGMEFGVISEGGHSIIYGMDSLMGWEPNQYQRFVERGNYGGAGGVFETINQHGNNAFVYLAHPESDDYNNLFSNAYSAAADDAIVGTALESGPANSTSIGYNNPGSSMAFLNYYKILLSKGYHVGPAIDHDNHNMTFGRTARTRLAIISAQLTEAAILQSMRQMRFYATQDCNAKISYTINGQQMGSVMLGTGTPVLNIGWETSSPVSSIRVMAGTPGSGNLPVQIANLSGNNLSYTDATLANFSERYYYLEITEDDGSIIVTAPIWYTRVDGTVASGGFTAFTAMNQPTSVLLKWSTIDEDNNAVFNIERSTDGGRTFAIIGSLAGKGSAAVTNNYSFTDNHPFADQAYYRIRLTDADGSVQLSLQRMINRSGIEKTAFNIYPNPVEAIANIHVYSRAGGIALITIYDMAGKQLLRKNMPVSSGQQVLALPMLSLTSGSYIATININGTQVTRTFYKK